MILLRTHSRYSFHRATASLEQLVDAAVADGMSHLALTDYFGMYGVVQFAQLCQRSGVKPIIGMMACVRGGGTGRPGILTLLAKDFLGYKSLCELSTIHQTEKETQGGGIEWERFKQSCQGLVCIACEDGEFRDEADCVALANLFGEDGYLGVGESSSSEWLALGGRSGLAPVWCEPVFHVDPADRELFRLLQAIDQNVRLEGVATADLPTVKGWVGWPRGSRGLAQMDADVSKQAVANTEVVANRCGDCLPDGSPLWPVLSLPEGKSAAEVLRETCETKLQTLYEEVSPFIKARLEAELDLITQHNFEPLFLILGEVIEFVQANNILMGSRGSVANSLVAYCLGISLVDPMKYELLFERFLNPERKSLPDIDLDFESRNGRDAVLGFIRQRYGEHRVALVSTVNTYRTKSAVRETAKAYGMSSAEISKISKQLPSSWRHPDPERRQKSTAEMVVDLATNDHEREVLTMAMRIRGFPSHMGLHPGGIVVSPPEKMTDHCPLFLSPKGFLATQFDFRDVETLGLIKMDVLGIRALTVIEIALEIINENSVRVEGGGKQVGSSEPDRIRPLRPLRVGDIPLEDEATGDLIERGDTLGVFQCESTGSQRTLRQLKARDPWGLALANAFFKPGPATGGQAKNFIRRIRGEEEVSYAHPILEPILSKTAGVLLFQEDVLKICTEVGGLNWTEANSIRKGMSKFEGSRIREMRERFVAGAIAKNDIDEAIAQTLWDQIEAFAGYGFNAGHALSYAIPSFQMAWLKTHYPAEFMTARLRAGGGYSHPSVNVAEARRLGFKVFGPHVNFSERKWKLVDQQAIYCGLGWVKDLRRSTIQTILLERENGLFEDFDDFVRRVPLREKELKHLVWCGALDGLGPNRNSMGEMKVADNQMSLFGATEMVPEIEGESAMDRFAWELEILGMPFSVRPTDFLHEENSMPLAQLHQTSGRVKTVGWRLPSFTGGKGFYVSDGEGLVLAWDKSKRPVRSWEPMVLVGEWKRDRFGGEWLQVERVSNN